MCIREGVAGVELYRHRGGWCAAEGTVVEGDVARPKQVASVKLYRDRGGWRPAESTAMEVDVARPMRLPTEPL